MKKLLTLLLIVGLGITTINAQDYEKAIGFKAGGGTLGTAGLNFKTFLSSSNAMDLTLSYGQSVISYNGANYNTSYFSLTALYEIHENAFGVDALNWYYGAGGSVGFLPSTSYTTNNLTVKTSSSMALGFLGVLGIEYTIPDIPVGIAFDLEPGLFYNNGGIYFGMQGALAIRYIIN